MIIFRFARFLCWVFAKLYLRYESLEHDNIPKTGGVIIAANHVSFLDPPLCGIGIKRPTHYFARNTLMKNAFLKWFYKELNCIPVNRDQLDMKTFRRVVKELKAGAIVILFPEGTRSPDGELQKGEPGTGMIVQHAKVPVVPCYIDGAAEAMPRGSKYPLPKKVRIIFGQPMDFSEMIVKDKREAYKSISNQIMDEIAELKAQTS